MPTTQHRNHTSDELGSVSVNTYLLDSQASCVWTSRARTSNRRYLARENKNMRYKTQPGQSTSFDKADGQHLSDFDATSHI